MNNKTIKKNAFSIQTGWNTVHEPIIVCNGGYYPLRPWQVNCHSELTTKTRRIINAPTGSGKSYMMTLLSVEDMLNNSKLKTIIAVPQTVIASGFRTVNVILPNGTKIHWVAGNDLCNDKPTKGTTQALIEFISGKSGSFNDRIALCTHATLVAVYKTLKRTNRLDILKNLNIWIDESHHVMNVEIKDVDDAVLSNSIGEFITHLLKSKTNHIGLATASFFRGDRCSLITEKQEKEFIRFNLPYDEYLKTMRHLKSFSFNFVLCGADWTKAFEEITSDRKKDIVYIPHPISNYSTGDKYKEAEDIILSYRKEHGGKRHDTCPLTLVGKKNSEFKILNLVDEDCREDKKTFINTLKSKDDLDSIITLGMFKEGANWVYAERAIIVGARESLVDMLQIIGRLFRDVEGKEHVEAIILLPFSLDQITDQDELKDNLNNYLKAIFSCLILENILDPIKIKMPSVPVQKSGTAITPKHNYLGDALPSQSDQLSLIEDVSKELIKISADAQENGKTIRVWDEYEKIIPDILTSHGVDENHEEIAKEIWAIFTRKTIKMKGLSVEEIDFDILKDVDPVESILSYTSGICGIDTFEKLRDALQLLNDSDKKKQQLLEMAKAGEPRPNARKKIGSALCEYTRKGRSSYDLNFTKEINKLAPQWFVDTAADSKKELLRMAKAGEPRPQQRKKIGGVLGSYIRKSHRSYDPNFTKEINKLAPQWFVDAAADSKKELLRMAKAGEPRPQQRKDKIGSALIRYTCKGHGSYDPNFTKEINKLAPQWSRNLGGYKE
jgi:hypothetical protein